MISPTVRLILLSCLFVLASAVFAAPPSKVLPDDEWVMLSPPANPETAGTLGELFGDDLPVSGYESSWVIFGWDPTAGADSEGRYFVAPANEPLETGRGYWMIQRTGADVTIDVPASNPGDGVEQIAGCSDVRGCIAAELVAREDKRTWSMVGFNHVDELAMARVRFVGGSDNCVNGCTYNQAVQTPPAVEAAIFRYVDGATGYERLTQSSDLQAWDAFWVLTGLEAYGEPNQAGELPANRILFPTAPAQASVPQLNKYEMVFNDEFNGGGQLDTNKWNSGLLWGPYLPINNEEQLYVDALGMHRGFDYQPFSLTTQGTLKITASEVAPNLQPPVKPANNADVWKQYLEYRPNPDYDVDNVNYLSGILTTYDTFKLSHGYVEARAKLPSGKGLWPALWLLNTHYVERVPEIDIMEFLGDNPNLVYHTYHYFEPENDWRLVSTPSYTTVGPDFTDGFHVFGVAWEPGQIIYYVDGVEVQRVKDEDFEIAGQAMYLILNLAVGGNWPGSPDANTQFPAVYEIDYIRAYKKKTSVPVKLSEYQLVFNDEFTGTELDADKWTTRFLWGPFLKINNEQQYYVDALGADGSAGYTPFTLSGGTTPQTGTLTITARTAADSGTMPPELPGLNDPYWSSNPTTWRQEGYTLPEYTSGLITSREAFQFSKGYAEIRAKVPEGDGLWPAFWLLNSYYVGPSPEIDIMEILGEDTRSVHHSFHYTNGVGLLESASKKTTLQSGAPSFSDDFHTFGVQWTHDEIHWYVDGVKVHSELDTEIAYQLMYVLANLAVGGDFNSQTLDPGAIPAELVIDYIRVYQERDTQ